MSTPSAQPSLERALSGVPASLRSKLSSTYSSLKKAHLQGEYDAVGLRAGKLAEILIRILQDRLTGTHVPPGTRLASFPDECAKLERTPVGVGPESLRILIPRALLFLYTMRNKRDIGHVGGDVTANVIDSETMVRIADWCVAELIRVFHSLPLEEAQAICDALVQRRTPWLWEVLGRKRILDPSLPYADQTLLLLYSAIGEATPIEDLFLWTEHSRLANYKRDVLARLHDLRQIEWDTPTNMALLSPLGVREVETRILPSLNGSKSDV
jgi:hypothetical protein